MNKCLYTCANALSSMNEDGEDQFQDFEQNERHRSASVELANTQATVVSTELRRKQPTPGASSAATQRPSDMVDRGGRRVLAEPQVPSDTQVTLVATQRRTQRNDVIDLVEEEEERQVRIVYPLQRHLRRVK